jgi:hypothetical protein
VLRDFLADRMVDEFAMLVFEHSVIFDLIAIAHAGRHHFADLPRKEGVVVVLETGELVVGIRLGLVPDVLEQFETLPDADVHVLPIMTR